MMNTIYVDTTAADDLRRKRLYSGQIFVYSPRPAATALCEFAREMIQEAFGPLDPRKAQYRMPVEEYVGIVSPLKPKFIHHPATKQLIRNVLEEAGCDLEKTYLDVPRLRMVTSDGYLTAGVGYAHHPHRDTWYSAPMCQINWWLPIYDIETESSMAFHPKYWDLPVKNESATFNYYEWNAEGRKNAAQHIKTDTRKQPHALDEIALDPQIRIVLRTGGAVLFSGAQMHSTIKNTTGLTRYSIDFRSVSIEDVVSKGGAPNIDSFPTGTSLRDFMRGTDLSPIPEEIVATYDSLKPAHGELKYQPKI